MSFHQLNLQKDGLHNLYNTVGDSPAAGAGATSNKNKDSVKPSQSSIITSPSMMATSGSLLVSASSLSSPMSMAGFLGGAHLVTPVQQGLALTTPNNKTSGARRDNNEEKKKDSEDDNDDDQNSISDVLSTISKRSWATISEIDSQCYSLHSTSASIKRRPSMSSRRSSSRSIAEADDEDDDDDDEVEAAPMRESQIRPPSTLTVVMRASLNGMNNVSARAGDLNAGTIDNGAATTGTATWVQTAGAIMREQAGGDSTSERGGPPTRSSSFSTRGTTHSTYNATNSVVADSNDGEDYPITGNKVSWRQRCLQAEEQVFEAREELAVVEAQLDSLQHRHALEVRDLHRQIVQHEAVQRDLRNSLQAQEEDLETMQTKLRRVQNEKETLEQHVTARSLVEDQEQQQKLASVGHAAAVAAASQDLQRQVEQLLTEKASAEKKLHDALQRLAVVESERDDALAQRDQLQSELETSQKRVRFAEDRNQVLEYQVADYDVKLKESKRQADETAEQLSTLEENLHTIQKDHKELRQLHLEVVKNQKAVYALKCLELEKQTENTEMAQQQLDSLQKEQSVLDENVKSLEQEQAQLQSRLDRTVAELEDASSRLKEREGVANQLQVELNAIQETARTLQVEKDNLQQDQKDMDSAHAEAVQMQVTLATSAEMKLQDVYQQVETLQNEKQQLQEAVDGVNEEYNVLKEQLKLTVQNLELANEKSAANEMERSKMELEYQKSQELVRALQDDRDTTRERHESIVAAFEKSITDLQSSAQVSQSTVEELALERDGLKTRLQELEAERSSLTEKHRTVQNAHNVLESTHRDLQQRLSQKVQAHEEAVTNSEKQMNDLQKDKDELQNTVEILRFEATHLQSLLLTANNMLSEAKVRLADEEEQKEQVKSQLDDLQGTTKSEREEERKELDSALKEKEKFTEQTASAIAELDAARESWNIELSKLQQERDEQEQELQKTQALYNAVVESRDECQRQLERALQSQETYRQSAEKQIEELKATAGKLLQKVETLEEQSSSLDEQLVAANRMLKETKDLLAEKEEANANLSMQLSLALKEVESLKSQLIAAAIEKETIDAMHAKKIMTLESERDGLQSELYTLQEHHSSVRVSLATVQQERDELMVAHETALLGHVQTEEKYTQEIAKVQSQVVDLQTEQESLLQMVSSLEMERSTLQSDVANETRKFENIDLALQRSIDNHQTTNLELQGLREAMDALETDRTRVLNEKLELQKSLIEQVARTSESEGKLEYLTQHCKKLQTELDNIRLSHSKVENELKQSKEQLQSPSKKDDTVTLRSIGNSMDESKLASLKEENKSLLSNKASLESQLQAKRLKLEKTETELVEKESDLKVWKYELEKSQRESTKIQMELETSRALLAEYSNRESTMDAELNSLKQLLSETENELQVRASVIANLEAEKDELNKQLVQANAQIAALQEDLGDVRLKMEDSVALVASATEMMANTAKEAEEFKVENQLLLATRTDLEKRNLDLEEELAFMREHNEKQTTKVRKLAKLLKRTLQDQAEKPSDHCRARDVDEIPDGIEVTHLLVDNDDLIGGSSGEYLNETPEACRVSRMKMQVKLQYHDKITMEKKKMEVDAKYTGPLVDSKPHGPGLLKLSCGDLYLGMFRNGEMDGKGCYVRMRKTDDLNESSASFFSGNFKKNEYQGPVTK